MDKSGSVSPNDRLHNIGFLRSTPRCRETTSPGGEQVAASETDLQLATEAT